MVAQLAHRLRLAPHARQAFGVQAVGLDDGDGDVTREPFIVRQVDALAPTFAEEAPDGVAAAGEGSGKRHSSGSMWLRG
jgi:hypothetical protein